MIEGEARHVFIVLCFCVFVFLRLLFPLAFAATLGGVGGFGVLSF